MATVTVVDAGSWASGVNLTGTTCTGGDVVSIDAAPRLHLLILNSHSGSVAFNLVVDGNEFPLQQTESRVITVPAAVGSVMGKVVIPLDSVLFANSSRQVALASGDPNLALLTYYAFTWRPSERVA